MKRLIMLAMLMIAIVGISGVAATPFSVDKDVVVSGGWVWENAWTLPSTAPITARYNFEALSPLATSAFYTEIEQLGTPWKYKLDMTVGANSAGNTHSLFEAVTVNVPGLDNCPSTEFSQFGFSSISAGEFSGTSLEISGEGFVSVEVSTLFDTAFTQINQVRLNE